jgi:hypothetical protein
MNHAEGHPALHACQQVDADTRAAITRQVARLDALLGQRFKTSEERQEAIALVESVYEQTKGTFCNCRIEGWYTTTRGALGVSVSWTPLGRR